MLEATPPSDFFVRSYESDVNAILIIGNTPPGFIVSLAPRVPIISVGKYQLGDSVHFREHTNPRLIELLVDYSETYNGFQYNNVLFANGKEIIYLGYELKLTSTERAVLWFLVHEAGRNVAVEEILEACLGDTHLKPSNVAKHVSAINRKAKEIGGRNMIFSPQPHYYRIRKYI